VRDEIAQQLLAGNLSALTAFDLLP